MNVFITGGCGFIGAHAARRWARAGHRVVVNDNLSGAGASRNLAWLKREAPGVEFAFCNVRDEDSLDTLLRVHRPEVVLHAAAQTAVTRSVSDPVTDFRVNAQGTLNLLESVRRHCPRAIVLYASTNKVYGRLDVPLLQLPQRVWPAAAGWRGFDEQTPLDFHSPYGCSKGAADQYVRDYARIFGLRTVVFRQSCVYGTEQWGTEDQGWVAWMAIRAALGLPITIYGDGRQVRDLLWIGDLLDLYDRAIACIDDCSGEIFNAGGGAERSLSVNELIEKLLAMENFEVLRAEARPGDQRIFVADTSKARLLLGWEPRVFIHEGLERLHEWTGRHLVELSEIMSQREAA